MQRIVEYSWETLRERGTHDDAQNRVESAKSGVQVGLISGVRRFIVVRRKNVLQWADEYTMEELTEYAYVMAGMYMVYLETRKSLTDGDIHTYSFEYNLLNKFMPSVGVPFPLTETTMAAKGNGKTGESEHTYADAAKVWGIPGRYGINMASTASLFYILYTRAVVRKEAKAQNELNYFVAKLAPDFAAYLDMVAGGEARHMINYAKNYVVGSGHAPAGVEEEALAGGHVSLHQLTGVPYLHDSDGKDLTGSCIAGHDRAFAWQNYYNLRKEYGMHALNWCIMAHCTVQSGSFGGPLWANCANLVRKRERGECNDIFFIDQALSLQHNGGAIFNKLWNVDNLKPVLDIAFRGEVDKLYNYLTPEHRAIVRQATYGVTAYDGVKHGERFQYHDKTIDEHAKSSLLGIKAMEDVLAKVNE